MTDIDVDHAHMARAIRLAARGMFTADPNPRVGCVIVSDGAVVGEGWHAHTGQAHAEVFALDEAGDRANGATTYVSLEPCCHHGRTPPCADALVAAGIKRVVMASRDPNPVVSGSGERRLTDAGVVVDSGILAAEARALNVGFFKRMETGRPFLRSKIAVSLDGRTALANGTSKWITGEAARADVHRLRARSSAILTGSGTVLADDPVLTARIDTDEPLQQPFRFIVDSKLSLSADARLLSEGGAVTIFCAVPDADAQAPLEQAGATVEVGAGPDGRVSLPAMMDRLGELEINEVLVEAGPTLNGALFEAGLIDELVIYIAGRVLGDQGRGMFSLPELTEMPAQVDFELVELRRVGQDCRLTYRPECRTDA
jgi:diaminohydroxyphosphoribosylaminopyrimidine deaminase/5-amino-6-(5-phosphoribosylamino)uracil reductase